MIDRICQLTVNGKHCTRKAVKFVSLDLGWNGESPTWICRKHLKEAKKKGIVNDSQPSRP